MSTLLANPSEMIRQGAPHLIHSDRELEAYTEALFTLTAKPVITRHDREAIDLLTLLIDRYESHRHPVPDAEPAEVLYFLLDRNGLTEADLVPDLGDEAPFILSGQRQLTRDQIARLSKRFHVDPSAFFPRT